MTAKGEPAVAAYIKCRCGSTVQREMWFLHIRFNPKTGPHQEDFL